MAGKLMHAVQYDSYGGGAAGLKHVEVPVPTPKKDEVLIKLEATSLNPVDWKIQKGILRPLMPRKFPHIPGTDVAGEVLEVGPGVKNFKTGDKIVAMLSHASVTVSLDEKQRWTGGKSGEKKALNGDVLEVSCLLELKSTRKNFWGMTGGGLAEFAVAKESLTVARPAEVSAAEGAGLPVAGLTAHQALTQSVGIKLDGSGKQANILITAASGGVGHYAVQLAKLGNIHVTATCGARNIEFVKSLGADEVLDYKTPEGAALNSPSGRKYDAVIHCATGIPWSTFEPNLSENGKVIDITPGVNAMLTFALKKLTFSKKQLVPLLMVPKAENLDYLVKQVKEGKLKTVIDSKHPLSKAEDAWAKSIAGHATGKVIVEP
ncbi:chloroplast envelope quinone oxidoreductase homolog isoform X1 [Hevea brasiliensis]|uniref:chloroplast envelope quinone oxidoreductase homolog isoform X1 n=1 Tax=Hevea brasiliensis TaxID=3981 RepID=UPI000B779C8C|nr:chloroplast envelope quinone oxidoreductase homolog isoform X1 [Hevea brasiliensis]